MNFITMKQNNNQIQQGDVMLFSRVPKLPNGCVKRKSRTIALGEHTGHHHTFEEGVSVFDAPDGKVFVVNESEEPKQLIHQEHNPCVAAPGIPYEFAPVQEKDWFTAMTRPVMD
jgi:hypothetical protein